MFADPQIVTINSVAKSMPRVEIDGMSAVYQTSDEVWKLSISHTTGKNGRTRSQARIDQRKVVTDPVTNVNDYDTLTFYIVLDRPGYGFSMVEVEQIVAGFQAWLNTTAVDKLFGKES